MDQTPKKTELPRVAKELDRTLYGADKQTRADDPRRRTSPGGYQAIPIPPAAALPVELAATQRPAEITTRETRQRPPAPSTLRKATPTALPKLEAWDSGYGGQQAIPSAEPPRSAPLPPPSQSPAEASRAARARENDRLRRERDDARSELVRRGREEATPVPAPQPETFRGVTLTQAKIGLLVAITGILTILTPFLAWKIAQLQGNAQRTETQASEASKTSEAAKLVATSRDRELADLKAQRQADVLYFLAILRKQGVEVRKPDGWGDLPPLDTEAPLRKPGKVSDGVVLTIKTPPPSVKASP